MKTTTLRKFGLASLIVIATTLSCTKNDNEEDEKAYNFCLVTKTYSAGADTGQSSSKYFYDNLDRLIYWDYSGVTDITYRYEPGKITVGNNPPDPSSYSTYYLSADSTSYASATYRQGQQSDTINYYYDNNKNLIKAVRYTPVFGIDSVVQTYTDGNLTKLVHFSSNGRTSQFTYQYTTITSKSWLYDHYGTFLYAGFYMPWFGRPNKNLIKTMRYEYLGNVDAAEINYEMNQSGYVKAATMTSVGNVDKRIYEYKCR